MDIDFDFEEITNTEFGVGIELDETEYEVEYQSVPVDLDVQNALKEMALKTMERMLEQNVELTLYEPSEKYASYEKLYLPINDDLGVTLKNLHLATNLIINPEALRNSDAIFCYFVRFVDNSGRKLTALRRATYFKGVLKRQLVRIIDDTLRIIDDNVFKLDMDFDLLVDNSNIYILRPSSFEFAGKLREAILNAVSENIQLISSDLSFVNFDSIEEYARTRPRAARYIASIKSQKSTKDINRDKLIALCNDTGVVLNQDNGQIAVEAGNEMGFLEVLDRRRYKLELIDGQAENYRALSRDKV